MAQRSFVRLHIDYRAQRREAIVHLQDSDYQTILLDLASVARGGDIGTAPSAMTASRILLLSCCMARTGRGLQRLLYA